MANSAPEGDAPGKALLDRKDTRVADTAGPARGSRVKAEPGEVQYVADGPRREESLHVTLLQVQDWEREVLEKRVFVSA